ncbi:MAG: hypothetical protein KDB16_03490 [Acidimicrobiales bacterium]|nr:hypothetical protein [Acidimicrobiales bacterium]
MLQWATGGLFFLWVTTRRREVSLGYGWLMRGTYIIIAGLGLIAGLRWGSIPVREVSAAAVVVAGAIALASSIVRRRAGVSGHKAEHDRRTERVAAMTGIERSAAARDDSLPEFDPRLDLIAPVLGVVGLVAAGFEAETNTVLAVARNLAGAAFIGAVTDAMLLGHWYLVQPGLKRASLLELVRYVGWTWFPEVVLLLVPTGMVSVWTGAIDDGYQGILGWFWGVSAVSTIVLVGVTVAALRERSYSAVMAATGLLYLAILTAFGTDLVARAVLVG